MFTLSQTLIISMQVLTIRISDLLIINEGTGGDDKQPRFVVTVECPALMGVDSFRSTEHVTK